MNAGRIRIGIGGWIFEPWRGSFYPAGLPKTQELAHASRQVTTIEINGTFYRTQNAQTFRKWAAETPDDFVFSLKAVRYAVNRRDLADGHDAIDRFLGSGIVELGAKLGPILWQLAGTKKFNPDEIAGFLSNLPAEIDGKALRHVIEPRHETFKTPEFIKMARQHNVAVCLAISDDYPLIADPTADFCYVRLQTTAAEHPAGYDDETLAVWADRLGELSRGDSATGLPLVGETCDRRPRDCFVYMISGAKERNPFAAQALLARLTDH